LAVLAKAETDKKCAILRGERGGTRTLYLLIKSECAFHSSLNIMRFLGKSFASFAGAAPILFDHDSILLRELSFGRQPPH
jgi:hypothetical protein